MRPQQQTFQPDLDDENTLAWQDPMHSLEAQGCVLTLLGIPFYAGTLFLLYLFIVGEGFIISLGTLIYAAAIYGCHQWLKQEKTQPCLAAVCDVQGLTFYASGNRISQQWYWVDIIKISYLQGGGKPYLAVQEKGGKVTTIYPQRLLPENLQEIAQKSARWLQTNDNYTLSNPAIADTGKMPNYPSSTIPAVKNNVSGCITPHIWYRRKNTISDANNMIFMASGAASMTLSLLVLILQFGSPYGFWGIVGIIFFGYATFGLGKFTYVTYRERFAAGQNPPCVAADEEGLVIYNLNGKFTCIPWAEMRSIQFFPYHYLYKMAYLLITDKIGKERMITSQFLGDYEMGESVATYANAILNGAPIILPEEKAVMVPTAFARFVLAMHLILALSFFLCLAVVHSANAAGIIALLNLLLSIVATVMRNWQSRCDDG